MENDGTVTINAFEELARLTSQMIKSREGKHTAEPFDQVERNIAGAINFMIDKLVEDGHNRGVVSEKHGWGVVVAAEKQA